MIGLRVIPIPIDTRDSNRHGFESRFLKLCYQSIAHRFVHKDRHLLLSFNPSSQRDELLERKE